MLLGSSLLGLLLAYRFDFFDPVLLLDTFLLTFLSLFIELLLLGYFLPLLLEVALVGGLGAVLTRCLTLLALGWLGRLLRCCWLGSRFLRCDRLFLWSRLRGLLLGVITVVVITRIITISSPLSLFWRNLDTTIHSHKWHVVLSSCAAPNISSRLRWGGSRFRRDWCLFSRCRCGLLHRLGCV